jgi:hypothetical protein
MTEHRILEIDSDRRRRVLDIAIECGVGLRKAAAANGVVRSDEFANGVIFGAMLLQKNMTPKTAADGEPDFLGVFAFEKAHAAQELADGAYGEQMEIMGAGKLAAVDQTPGEMTLTVGLSAENLMLEVASDYDLDRTEILHAMAFVVCAASVAGERRLKVEEALSVAEERVDACVDAWDQLFPSDADLFGEEVAQGLEDFKRNGA